MLPFLGVIEMKLKNVELKPCPICGGKAEYKSNRMKGGFKSGVKFCSTKRERYIRCSVCHARTRPVGMLENAINCWNLGEIYSVK